MSVRWLYERLRTYQPSLLLSPPQASTFSVAILHESETEGTRLLGYIEIGRGEVLGSVESNRCSRCILRALSIITEDYNLALQIEFNKVNLDGPALKFSAGFTVSELPYQEVFISMAENTSKIPYISSNYSLSHLQLPLSVVRA